MRKVHVAVLLLSIAVPAFSQRLAKGTLPFFEPLNGPADVIISKVVVPPGGSVGWHYHPGHVFVIVNSGTITETTGCGDVEVHTAGEAWVEVQPARMHRVDNFGSTNAELYVTNIFPAGMPGSIAVAAPLCGPPTDVSQCMKEGWTEFQWPRTFANQGDCVSYVNSLSTPGCEKR